jgi:ABC-type bacteriocin/lantibiotic exporter with double-glycine peptidase domain
MIDDILLKCNMFYKQAVEISGVKPFEQTPSYCGAASLHIVLKFYGTDVPEKTLAKLSKTTKKDGTEAPRLLEAAKHYGFDGFYLKDCDISDIKSWIRKGFPVIVEWFSVDDSHFSVVYGIDDKKIYLQDPENGRKKEIDLDIFSQVWFGFNKTNQIGLVRRLMLVVYPKDKTPKKK